MVYLVFVSVSMAMSGMTAVLICSASSSSLPARRVAARLRQFSLAMAIATPLALVTMLAILIDSVPLIQSLRVRLFCAVIVDFIRIFGDRWFVCSMRLEFAIGRVYFVESFGCCRRERWFSRVAEAIRCAERDVRNLGILFLSVLAYERLRSPDQGSGSRRSLA